MGSIRFIASVGAAAVLAACGGGNNETGSEASTSSGATPAAKMAPLAQRFVPQAFEINKGNYNFSLSRATHKVTNTPGLYTVFGPSGAIAMVDSEWHKALVFTDMSVNLEIQADAARISQADLDRLIELYIAFFNRVPDADGLHYWIKQVRAGTTIRDIAQTFYGAAVQYASVTGYSKDMTDENFVKLIYQNVLGRTGDTAASDTEVGFWASRIRSGEDSHGSLVQTMLVIAHQFENSPSFGWVPKLLNNKIAVAKYFAVTKALNYNTPEESIAKTMAIAKAVTPTDTLAAVAAIGISDGDYLPPVAVSYAGRYAGSYSGSGTGTFAVDVAENGAVTGSGKSFVEGQTMTFSGSMMQGGQIILYSNFGPSYFVIFNGYINPSYGTVGGSWEIPGTQMNGSFNGQKLSAK